MENSEIRNEQPEYNWPQIENGMESIDNLLAQIRYEIPQTSNAHQYIVQEVGNQCFSLSVYADYPFIEIYRDKIESYFVFSRYYDDLLLHQVGDVAPNYLGSEIVGLCFNEANGSWADPNLDKAVIGGIASLMNDIYRVANGIDQYDSELFNGYAPLLDKLNDYYDAVARQIIRYNDEENEDGYRLLLTEFDPGTFPPSVN